jgi:excisionase family DNA binding protein
MAIAIEREPVAIEETRRPEAAHAAEEVSDYLAHHSANAPPSVTLESEGAHGATTLRVPEEALRLLADILREMAAGHAVTVVPYHAEITTQQAAELMNVSRPYVVKLIESDEIPCRMVGPRRRIRFEDLMAYKRRDDAHRRAIADELTREAEELGMGYDVTE